MEKRDYVLVLIMGVLFFGLSFLCWGKKAEDFSDSERRVLAKRPEASMENILDGSFMEQFEEYTLDQFPYRDSFRSLKAMTSLGVFQNKDNNKIYYADGHLSKVEYPLQKEMLDYAAEKMNYIYETYLKNNNSKCYLTIVPDKNYFLAEENGYLALDYKTLFSHMSEKLSFAEYLDIVPFLGLEDYYKTDTHWRQERIVDVAEYLRNAMLPKSGEIRTKVNDLKSVNTELQGKEDTQNKTVKVNTDGYEKKKLDQAFYGVYYGQSALPVKPDELYYLTNKTLENCIVTSFDTGKAKPAQLYNLEKAAGKDAYEFFLEGANALLVIENPMAEKNRELLVFRDSFGSSLVPLMIDNYSRITVIDIRYVQSAMLGKLIDFQGQDVLFIYSTLILNQSRAFK